MTATTSGADIPRNSGVPEGGLPSRLCRRVGPRRSPSPAGEPRPPDPVSRTGEGSPISSSAPDGGPASTQGLTGTAAWLPISDTSRSSMSAGSGLSFRIFLRIATALVAKPSRARSPASLSRTSIASSFLSARARTWAS